MNISSDGLNDLEKEGVKLNKNSKILGNHTPLAIG